MFIRSVKAHFQATPAIEGAGVHLRRAFLIQNQGGKQ